MFIKYDNEKMRADLKKYLKDNSMTAREFSKKSSVSASTLCRIMKKGAHNSSTKTILAIVNGMDKRIHDYIINIGNVHRVEGADFEYLSIEDLTDLIEHLTIVRSEKIRAEISKIESNRVALNEQINIYKKMLEEES